jgi:hypothetical protein
MILRRVITHVRQQEWTAIAIDFVIVVAGVFVGMQVANWNEEQADNRRARAYAERLAIDLRKDLESRRALTAYYGAVLQSVERTNALLADPAADPQQLVVHAYRASEINLAPQTRSTWDEIVASGDIGLLPRVVESGVSDYYAADVARLAFEAVSNSAYRRRVRTIIPLELQQALRRGCSDVRDEAQQIVGFMPDCELDVEPGAIQATAAALRGDQNVQAELRYQYSEVFSARANISGDVVFLERALATLKGSQLGATEATGTR